METSSRAIADSNDRHGPRARCRRHPCNADLGRWSAAPVRSRRGPSSTPVSMLILVSILGCAKPRDLADAHRVPIVGGPCEGCEAVFEGMPANLSETARIAAPNEPGEPLRIEGKVTHVDGTAAPGTIVYAYHTNDRGIYPKDESLRGQAAYQHGSLRGWARAGDDGRYQFETIRPAGYPTDSTPAHVHMHVIEPGRCTYYIDSIHFTDDPRLTPVHREAEDLGRGGSGIVTPSKDSGGTWRVQRDIILGAAISGYPPHKR